ncbi:hypothetical protein F5Y13DRAFT_185091 [Hypoxylon sp. FL1857]|nr:hypothetical protein F5Y13DRAFT_185091 [Hypoxylon sp. FL1857]
MAPVPFQHPVRYAPLAAVGIHIASVIYLTYAIAASLYTSYKSLSPAQDTRSRIAQRKRLVPAFLGLAVAALSLATYTSIASASLSYKTWAYEHGLDRPERFISDEEIFLEPENSSKLNLLYITHWLSDTSIYYDALEIVAEKARRFWWGQQIDLATVAFSMLLSIEGRRRNIPLTTSFLLLAHLVNLSFAQNLFYLALLMTPSPLPQRDGGLEPPAALLRPSSLVQKLIPPKPKNWHINPSILLMALVLNYGAIFLLPYAAETSSFAKVALLTRAFTFLPLILPTIVPVNWGTVHLHPHDAYGSFKTIFRIISAVSFVLHVKSSVAGLVYNLPNSHHHRHSVFFPWDVEERTAWERSTTALGKILGAVYDHPAVNAVGLDVLNCALSLGLWVAVRATDVQDIIEATIPFYDVRRKIEHAVDHNKLSIPAKADPEPTDDAASEHSMTLRRRGRSAKSRLGSVASSSGPSEDGAGTPGRRRGRPKKNQPEEEKAYEPASSEIRQLAEGDVLPSELDWESAALAWGLAAFAGLGSASAGVFGGECISR